MSILYTKPMKWTKIYEDICSHGICIIENFLSPQALPVVDQWLDVVMRQNLFNSAKIGTTQKASINKEVRNDKTFWIEELPKELSEISDFLNQLKDNLNQEFFLNIKSYEIQLSLYEKGAYYQKHFDNSLKNNHRVITAILYLNPHWQASDGGQLVIYSDKNHNEKILRINPDFGKLVLFRSELFPHEVIPTHKNRFALTGWYRNDQ